MKILGDAQYFSVLFYETHKWWSKPVLLRWRWSATFFNHINIGLIDWLYSVLRLTAIFRKDKGRQKRTTKENTCYVKAMVVWRKKLFVSDSNIHQNLKWEENKTNPAISIQTGHCILHLLNRKLCNLMIDFWHGAHCHVLLQNIQIYRSFIEVIRVLKNATILDAWLTLFCIVQN